MQISSINNQNFKGLWVKSLTQGAGRDKETGTKVVDETYTYYPFRGESEEEIKFAIDEFNGKKVYAYYNDNDHPSQIANITTKRGSTLDISSKDYSNVGSPISTKSAFEEKVLVEK